MLSLVDKVVETIVVILLKDCLESPQPCPPLLNKKNLQGKEQ